MIWITSNKVSIKLLQHKNQKKKKTILSQPLLRRVHQATQVRISKLVTGRGIIVKSEKISGWLLPYWILYRFGVEYEENLHAASGLCNHAQK